MILTAARVLERSVATNVGSWLVGERRIELERIDSGLKSKLGTAMLSLAQKYPALAAKTLDLCAQTNGHKYLGAGVEFSAYLRLEDKKAIKVHRASAGQSDEALGALAEDKKQGHKLLEDYLGKTVLPQTVMLAEHVLGGGFQTLQIEQPYIELTRTASPFEINNPQVDCARLEKSIVAHPGADVALRELILQSRSLYFDKEQLPDTNGSNNLTIQTDGSLVLLDSTPIGSEHPAVQELILDQVQSLERGLIELGV